MIDLDELEKVARWTANLTHDHLPVSLAILDLFHARFTPEIAMEMTQEIRKLRAALKGVIRVADRNTAEFDFARAALEEK